MPPARRARDNLLDRYYPNLTPEERDLGHDRMRNFGRMLGYVRVCTVKQGEHGSSLVEQRPAIDSYARRHDLKIAGWFEEMKTAAKHGRRNR